MNTVKTTKLQKGITEVIEGKNKFYRVNICKRMYINSKVIKFERRTICKTKPEAEKAYSKLLELVIRDVAKKEGNGIEWLQLVNDWKIFHLKSGYETITETTVIDYGSLLKCWTHEWNNIPAREISKQMVKTAITRIKKERSIKHTAKLKDSIKSVFQWAIDNEIVKGINESPTNGVVVSRKCSRMTEVLREEEVKKLLQTAKNQGNEWYPVWSMAIYTGQRSGEMFTLKWSNVDFDKMVININEAYKSRTKKTGSTKTGEQRVVPINDELMQILVELKPKTFESGYVLPRLKDWQSGRQAFVLKTFCENIGITPVQFRTLRATFTTLMLSNGVGLNVVQAIGGWRDIATMNHYNRLSGLMIANSTKSLSFIR
jgi:integrase